jgi:hypothetical protein
VTIDGDVDQAGTVADLRIEFVAERSDGVPEPARERPVGGEQDGALLQDREGRSGGLHRGSAALRGEGES